MSEVVVVVVGVGGVGGRCTGGKNGFPLNNAGVNLCAVTTPCPPEERGKQMRTARRREGIHLV